MIVVVVQIELLNTENECAGKTHCTPEAQNIVHSSLRSVAICSRSLFEKTEYAFVCYTGIILSVGG